jgi:hypothetical protein
MFCIILCFYLWIYETLNKISYHITDGYPGTKIITMFLKEVMYITI